MPHQCVRCGTLYEDGASEILKGCSCGSRLFFFVRKDAVKKAEEVTKKLTTEEKKAIEKDVLDIVGEERAKEDQPIILDFESINVLEPGQFELDLVHLFKKDPLIYKVGDGKYIIDLPTTFNHVKKLKAKKKK
ncbi:Zn-ribbon domain-containing protein [Candidatus Woesearchaeota archaeon]|nr:Zn-ribbon domain-containing protein [Candidatus Woesearchaeota archaeon]